MTNKERLFSLSEEDFIKEMDKYYLSPLRPYIDYVGYLKSEIETTTDFIPFLKKLGTCKYAPDGKEYKEYILLDAAEVYHYKYYTTTDGIQLYKMSADAVKEVVLNEV